MHSRNLILYRLPAGWSMTAAALEEKLTPRPLAPCTGLSLQSRGWVAPGPTEALVYSQEQHLLIAMGIEQKLLPAAVVRQTTDAAAVQYERLKGFKPGRKMMRELKDQVTAELLPRAFVRQRKLHAWIDMARGWLVVGSSSPGRAEELVELLRDSLGELAVNLVETDHAPSATLTAWLASGNPPSPFALDDDAELKGSDSSRPTVRYTRHPLEGETSLARHIQDGKFATRLALTWNERLALVVTERLQILRVKFLAVRDGDDQIAQSPEEQFDADFALMAGELGELIADLGRAMRFRS